MRVITFPFEATNVPKKSNIFSQGGSLAGFPVRWFSCPDKLQARGCWCDPYSPLLPLAQHQAAGATPQTYWHKAAVPAPYPLSLLGRILISGQLSPSDMAVCAPKCSELVGQRDVIAVFTVSSGMIGSAVTLFFYLSIFFLRKDAVHHGTHCTPNHYSFMIQCLRKYSERQKGASKTRCVYYATGLFLTSCWASESTNLLSTTQNLCHQHYTKTSTPPCESLGAQSL